MYVTVPSVLLIDSDAALGASAAEYARAKGCEVKVASTYQQAEQLEQAQEALAQGPCTDAFWQRAPVPVRDVTREGGEEIAAVDASFRAALSVPVELAGGAGRHPGCLRATRARLERE